MNIDHAFFDRFLDGLSGMLGDKCEIVVHDFSNGFEHTVVKIINSVTGRSIGDAPTNLFFKQYQKNGLQMEDTHIYFTDFPDGKTFKSFTTFIRDDADHVVGAVCINMDVTEWLQAAQLLSSYVGKNTPARDGELYLRTLDELMDYYLEQVEQIAGKSAADMDKAEKLEALDYLEQKGVLHMSKANIRLCEFFNFSKFTLYNYLDEIRNQREKSSKMAVPPKAE